MKNDNEEKATPCGYCGYVGVPVFVHGHGECKNCRNNIDECCSGERNQPPVDDPDTE